MTARSARRAIEVGVRKVSGAERLHLAVQFIGEALIYAACGLLAALGAVHFALPALDASLAPGITEQWLTPQILAWSAALACAVGVLGGAYPAAVLSAFRPAAVLKGRAQSGGSTVLRGGLVTLQFGLLIAIILTTLVISRQTAFGLRDGLRYAQDQMLLVYGPCKGTFVDEVEALPGVVAAACSNRDPLNTPSSFTQGILADGSKIPLGIGSVGYGYFRTYGIPLSAGREFDASRDAGRAGDERAPIVILNEAAARAFGFALPQDAIGQYVANVQNNGGPPSEVVGVVPDFTFDTMAQRTPSMILRLGDAYTSDYAVLNVKLSGQTIPETVEAIDALWKRIGSPRPIHRMFVDQTLQDYYLQTIRQARLMAGLAAAAVIIACLGLFGLAAFTAEQRTKEIGIRKSMGADTGDVLRLLLWQFVKPVLWANLIAWPLGYFAMRRWLEGFAYHIDLSPWMFLGASALALGIAILTVAGHAFLVARAQPVTALRYE